MPCLNTKSQEGGNSQAPSSDPTSVTCDPWQTAISALADGEDPGVEPRLLEAHLTTCGSCRAFQSFCDANRGRTRIQLSPQMPDLSGRVVKLNRLADRASRWGVLRAMLAVAALEVIIFSLRALVLGQEEDSSVHAARHLGAFTVAYGVGLLVVAVRPARARAMLPVAAVLAGALAITALIDMVNGEVPLIAEASHLPELISVILVWLLAIPSPRRADRGSVGTVSLRAVNTDDASGSSRAAGDG